MAGNILKSIPVAAGGSNSNLVTGDPFEIAQRNSLVSMGLIASLTGTFFSASVGPRLLCVESSPYVAATTYPIIPDQMQFNFIQLAGERLVVSARNPTAGIITFGLLASIQDA